MSLESDIERIARLRGKPANDYTAKLNAPRQLNIQLLANAFSSNGNQRDDMRMSDRLPKASRDFIRDCPIWISSVIYASLLENAPSEASMIATMRIAVNERLERTSRRKMSATR